MRTSFHPQASLFVVIAFVTALAGSTVRGYAGPPPDPVRSWNELALQTVRATSASDAQAARLYAMVNVAMYDAVNGLIARHGHEGRTHALVPPAHHAKGSEYAAAAAAAYAVLTGEYPNLTVSLYEPQLASDLAALRHGGKTEDGRRWGAYVETQVRAARVHDDPSSNETQPGGTGPGRFRASWSGVVFRNLVPFGITNSSIYVGSNGPPPLASRDYAGAWAEVKIIGQAVDPDPDPEKRETFLYWSLGSGTSQPPGAWIQVALAVTGKNPLPLPEQSRLFALVSIAMADTVAPTVMTKWIHKHWRPATAIIDAHTDGNSLTEPREQGWNPRAGGIGSSPEYWSGHSSFSAAAAATLAGFYCNDDIPFTLLTDTTPANPPNPPNQSRTYPSFSAAANEAGPSRVVGGIHFRFSNEAGLAAGRAVAVEILRNKLLLRDGPTHYGQCPL